VAPAFARESGCLQTVACDARSRRPMKIKGFGERFERKLGRFRMMDWSRAGVGGRRSAPVSSVRSGRS
jgi:hypothetical protein